MFWARQQKWIAKKGKKWRIANCISFFWCSLIHKNLPSAPSLHIYSRKIISSDIYQHCLIQQPHLFVLFGMPECSTVHINDILNSSLVTSKFRLRIRNLMFLFFSSRAWNLILYVFCFFAFIYDCLSNMNLWFLGKVRFSLRFI